MRWSEAYATGITEIDEQHKMLFKIVGDYRKAHLEGLGAGVYGMLLQLLETYCQGHFGFEERCMEAYRCPMAAINKAAHRDFLITLNTYRVLYKTHGYQLDSASTLLETLDSWLKNHLLHVDSHLKRCSNTPATPDEAISA